MIVARGLGRGSAGAIVAAGLCLSLSVAPPEQPPGFGSGLAPPTLMKRKLMDDRDLLEIMPAFVEIINGRR